MKMHTLKLQLKPCFVIIITITIIRIITKRVEFRDMAKNVGAHYTATSLLVEVGALTCGYM